MKKFREFLSRPSVTLALLLLAVVLLGGSAVGGARAALNVQSNEYESEMNVSPIGTVAVVENGEVVEGSDTMLKAVQKTIEAAAAAAADPSADETDGRLKIGKAYPEELAVINQSGINKYVRVYVYRYWKNDQGQKLPDMKAEWIKLDFALDKGWSIDEDSDASKERTILYYDSVLGPGETSEPFLRSVSIDKAAVRKITQTVNDHTIHTTYDYNGLSFCLEVHVDAVQDHNAEQAKLSAWGVNK